MELVCTTRLVLGEERGGIAPDSSVVEQPPRPVMACRGVDDNR